jgi:hypothetical protein
VPTAFVAASRHDVVRPSDLRYAQRHFGMQLHEVAGSHLFPLEQPLATAHTILQLLPGLLTKT